MSLLLIVICGIFLCQPTVNFKQSFSVQAGRGDDTDYWTEDFDTHKNCQQEKKITELLKEVGVPSSNSSILLLSGIAETI